MTRSTYVIGPSKKLEREDSSEAPEASVVDDRSEGTQGMVKGSESTERCAGCLGLEQ